MTLLDVVTGLTALAVAVYLLFTLLRAERI
jgi:hypothetical protein